MKNRNPSNLTDVSRSSRAPGALPGIRAQSPCTVWMVEMKPGSGSLSPTPISMSCGFSWTRGGGAGGDQCCPEGFEEIFIRAAPSIV